MFLVMACAYKTTCWAREGGKRVLVAAGRAQERGGLTNACRISIFGIDASRTHCVAKHGDASACACVQPRRAGSRIDGGASIDRERRANCDRCAQPRRATHRRRGAGSAAWTRWSWSSGNPKPNAQPTAQPSAQRFDVDPYGPQHDCDRFGRDFNGRELDGHRSGLDCHGHGRGRIRSRLDCNGQWREGAW